MVMPLARIAICAIAVLALAACAVKPRRDDVGWRPVDGVDPAAATVFRVAGRLAVSDGREGGSAGFLWTQRGDAYEVELRQPVSQRTWRLRGDQRGAVLEGGEGGPRRSSSAEALLWEALGWQVPVGALRDWVRGLPGDAPIAASDYDDQGRLRRLEQDGWRVDYRAWLDDGRWPTRIHASQPPYSLRLSIQDWTVGDG